MKAEELLAEAEALLADTDWVLSDAEDALANATYVIHTNGITCEVVRICDESSNG